MNLAKLIHLYPKLPNIDKLIVSLSNNISDHLLNADITNHESYLKLVNNKVSLYLKDAYHCYHITFQSESFNLQVDSIIFIEEIKNTTDLLIVTDLASLEYIIAGEGNIDQLIKEDRVQVLGNNSLLVDLINFTSQLDLSLDNILSYYFGDVNGYIFSKIIFDIFDKITNTSKTVVDTIQSSMSNSDIENDDPFVDHSNSKNSSSSNLASDIANVLNALDLKLPKESLTILYGIRSVLDNATRFVDDIIEHQENQQELVEIPNVINEVKEETIFTTNLDKID